MLQQEFETRVKMQVSPQEFNHINEVYMASEVDKDTFCHLWMVMNKGRINAAREAAKQKAAEDAQRERLWHVLEKYGTKSYEWKEKNYASNVLTDTEYKLIKSVGIDTFAKRMSDVCWEIRKYLKSVKAAV